MWPVICLILYYGFNESYNDFSFLSKTKITKSIICGYGGWWLVPFGTTYWAVKHVRADLLALVCAVQLWVCHFPIGTLVRCGTWLYRFLIFAPLLTLHFCTMRLYYKHHFIYQNLTGSHVRAFVIFIVVLKHVCSICSCNFQNKVNNRPMAENGFDPPLGNFADISYLVENWKPSLLRHVCTLCFGALVCKSL